MPTDITLAADAAAVFTADALVPVLGAAPDRGMAARTDNSRRWTRPQGLAIAAGASLLGWSGIAFVLFRLF